MTNINKFRLTQLSRLFLLGVLIFSFFSCNQKKTFINISSKYKGWIYLIASTDKNEESNLYADTNGIVYMPDFCQSKKYLVIKVDGKETPQTKVHFDNIFSSGNMTGREIQVSYSRFYFPLTSQDLGDKIDTGIFYNDRMVNNFEYLFETKKIDKRKITSCE